MLAGVLAAAVHCGTVPPAHLELALRAMLLIVPLLQLLQPRQLLPALLHQPVHLWV